MITGRNNDDVLELHQQDTPLLIGNVWDASSANIVSRLGFSAVGTSSAAIAYTLGYEDGENMPFNELLFMVERISRVVCVPLTVDLEAGYGETADDIAANILQLAKLGVVGINLEDSNIIDGKRTLRDAADFALTLSSIRSALNHANIDMFINARADAFIMKTDDALAQTLDRATRYESRGRKWSLCSLSSRRTRHRCGCCAYRVACECALCAGTSRLCHPRELWR